MAEWGGYTTGAVTRLLEAAELDERAVGRVAERVPVLGDAPAEAVLLGIVLGVFASQV
jgi:hypothetical protein